MSDDRFEIGGEELLAPVKTTSATIPPEMEKDSESDSLREAVLEDIRVRVGTLLKTETVSLLLGAGASVDCGGQLIGSVPLPVEQTLINEGVTGADKSTILRWLEVFYLAVRYAGGGDSAALTHEKIFDRRETLQNKEAKPLKVNYERVLATLYRWRSALPETGIVRLRVDGTPPVDTTGNDLVTCIAQATRALARACNLPSSDKKSGLATYTTLVRKLLSRPLNLKRVNVFTLNYDTLIEQAADASGVVLLDGFVGTQDRVFRPESYEQDLYFPAETTEGRVHRFDRVLHLYKLHGSITWTANEPTINNPYGMQSVRFDADATWPLLIYPTPAKYGETLGLPYSELFRRFAGALVRPQSVLFVIGYGFGDEHVNAIIRQALATPSFTMVIVDPEPKSAFVTELEKQQDRRIWIAKGPNLGTISGFVDKVLPDLRDEEIRQKVIKTHNALAKSRETKDGSSSGT